MKKYLRFICSLIILAGFAKPVNLQAHNPNQSYIFFYIYENSVDGIIEITINDLNKALSLSLEPNSDIESVTPYISKIQAYALQNIGLSSAQGIHAIKFKETTIFEGGNRMGNFVQLHFSMGGVTDVPKALDIRYEVLFEADPDHQGMIVIAEHWKAGVVNNEAMVSLIFNNGDEPKTLAIAEGSIMQGFTMMIKSGIHHIWIGLDHILFLLALILPSVMKRMFVEDKSLEVNANTGWLSKILHSWKPVESFKPAFIYVVKIITFFTIAHTITLSLAALDVFTLSSRIVESIIALSIALAAFHNIYPLFKGRDWMIAFIFGLFHGFGFASVLGDVGVGQNFMTLTLFGFNLGVEIGQLAIICLIFPVLYLIRKQKIYPGLLIGGSVLLIFISLYWFIERFFEVDILLGKLLLGTIM